MDTCVKCIVPKTFPGVSFENGVCTFCRNHEISPKLASPPLGHDKLLQVLTSKPVIKYNCVVGLSGGKDSSYALYYVARKLGLKPLAVFFDNGFVVGLAKQNIKKICSALDVDLVVRNASPYRPKVIKEHLYLSEYTGITWVCFCCENNLRSSVINVATENEIPFIIWGSTTFEDPYSLFLNPAAKSFREARKTNKVPILDSLVRLFINPLREPIKRPGRLLYYYHSLKARYYMVRDNLATNAPEGWRKLNPFLNVSFDGKKPAVIYFFDYLQYNPPQMVATLKQELDWRAPAAGKEARLDCKLGCFGNYQHYQNTGLTKDGFTLSVLVRHGLLDRSEALAKEEAIKTGLAEDCAQVRSQIMSMR